MVKIHNFQWTQLLFRRLYSEAQPRKNPHCSLHWRWFVDITKVKKRGGRTYPKCRLHFSRCFEGGLENVSLHFEGILKTLPTKTTPGGRSANNFTFQVGSPKNAKLTFWYGPPTKSIAFKGWWRLEKPSISPWVSDFPRSDELSGASFSLSAGMIPEDGFTV